MRMLMIMSVLAMVWVFFVVGTVSAVKPDKGENPNGFPPGFHWNMNMIGKKDNFTCPVQEYALVVVEDNNNDGDLGAVVTECDPEDLCEEKAVHGKVVFIPENGDDIEIYMQSPKGNEAVTDLQVTDPCAGFDSDPAEVQLPSMPGGCRVFARALAKPTNMPTIWTNPQFEMTEDDNGSTLIYLGEVSGSKTKGMQRKKGRSVGESISDLLQWTGTICSLDSEYGGSTQLCALDSDGDGTFDTFESPGDTGCPTNYVLLYCNSYDEEWIFNIPTLTQYLWHVNNEGVKLLQIRFYPN